MKLANRVIGDTAPCYIIAEAGLNHNGDIKMAKELIKTAADIKVDAIKFQIFKTEELCSKSSKYFKTFKSVEFTEKE